MVDPHPSSLSYIYMNINGPIQPHTKRLETFSMVARSGVWCLSCYDRLTLQEAAVEGSPSYAIDGIITHQRSAIANNGAYSFCCDCGIRIHDKFKIQWYSNECVVTRRCGYCMATSRAPHDVRVLTVIREAGRAGSGMTSHGTGSWRDIPAF